MITRTPQIPDALQALRPGAGWVLRGDEWSGLEWLDQVQTCPTEEEVNAKMAELATEWALDKCRKQAKQKIAEVDWTVLPDVNISNKADFEAYRTALRQLIFNPVASPVWPVEPNPVWL
jgi:hypothetical protein